MRALTLFALVSLACYGEVTAERRFNCSQDNDCPSGTRCAGILSDGSGCTGPEGWAPPEDMDFGRAEPDWYFLCIDGFRFYPFCVDEQESLECNNFPCEGTVGEAICVAEPAAPNAVCHRVEDVIRDSCDGCNPPANCKHILTFDEDGYTGGPRCVGPPAGSM